MTSWIMTGVALLALLVTFQPRLLRSDEWRATVTPLASIIGSGFLVAGPILGSAAGSLAFLAMAGLCGIAWLFGSAIRYNIATVETLLDPDGDGHWGTNGHGAGPPAWLPHAERLSDLALAFSYFISVAYYLNLFAAFALRTFGVGDPKLVAALSCAVIALLGAIGTLRGLRWLENIELPAVGLKLALIAGLIAALGWSMAQTIGAGEPILPRVDHSRGMHEIGILLGLVILVQGFETSRYLGRAYDAPRRIRTMRRAQLLASAIYLAFVALVTPFFSATIDPAHITETEIIDLLQPLGWAVTPLVILTALASQLSAAVADMNGAGGLINAASQDRLSVKTGYAGTAAVAIAITLSADIFEIIVYASKAFVLYYGLQAGTAALLCLRREAREPARAALYLAMVSVAATVIILGVPAG